MYQHVQRSPMHLLLYLPTTIVFALGWQAFEDFSTGAAIATGIVVVILLILALSFQTLTISDDGDHLEVRYGPLNLFGTKIAFRDMTAVEQSKTSIVDGWGIHFIPFRGWTFNLWGFECAKIYLGEKVNRIGTDDSENLVEFLDKRIRENSPQDQRSTQA